MSITNTIEPTDIYWDFDGETIFEEQYAIAHLLINEVIFFTKNIDNKLEIYVICNDVFAWGFADCELIDLHEIENLYQLWSKNSMYGDAFWCILKRGELPQKPVYDMMVKAGYNFDGLNLLPNSYDTFLSTRVTAGSTTSNSIVKFSENL